MLLLTNLTFTFGLFMFCGALVHCHLNVYLNLHEVIRLIGERTPNLLIRIRFRKCVHLDGKEPVQKKMIVIKNLGTNIA